QGAVSLDWLHSPFIGSVRLVWLARHSGAIYKPYLKKRPVLRGNVSWPSLGQGELVTIPCR
ncbi:hypothetical protein GIB67_012731, partial [Kingdonia uniflora]